MWENLSSARITRNGDIAGHVMHRNGDNWTAISPSHELSGEMRTRNYDYGGIMKLVRIYNKEIDAEVNTLHPCECENIQRYQNHRSQRPTRFPTGRRCRASGRCWRR